jgi:hypothetical protein
VPAGEVIVFPDVEDVAIGYLTTELSDRSDTALVTDEIPSPNRPDRIVVVESAGPGGDINLTTTRRSVIVQCWDGNRSAAAKLAETCFALLKAAQGQQVRDDFIRKVTTVSAPTYFPDARTDLPRYQFTVALDLAGHAI